MSSAPLVPEFDLKRGKRRTIALHVDRLGRLEVRAPHWVSRRAIIEFVIEREAWIDAQRARLARQPAFEEPEFREGGRVRLFGQPRCLQLNGPAALCFSPQPADAGQDTLLEEPLMPLVLPVATDAVAGAIEAAYRRLLRAHLLAYLTERLAWWRKHDAINDIPDLDVRIRLMKRRWGSCRRDGRLPFSESLGKYPPECIEAVIVHELCHLRHFNHGKAFYALLGSVLPDWRSADRRLEAEAKRY